MNNPQKLNGTTKLDWPPGFGNVMNGITATYCLWHHLSFLAKGEDNSHSDAPLPAQDGKSLHSTIYPQFIPDCY